MSGLRHRTQDLFEPKPPLLMLTLDLQKQLKTLLQTLLSEAAEFEDDHDAAALREAHDDEDHR